MIAFEELRKILLLENVSDSMLGKDDSAFCRCAYLAHGTLYFGRVMMRICFYMLNEGKVRSWRWMSQRPSAFPWAP